MAKLPAIVKPRAAGGTTETSSHAMSEMATAVLTSPEDTFGVLRDLLQGLESRLRFVRRDVERREALASSTPSIWPAHGWLTGTFGGRSDPFTGEPGYHQGLDISTDNGGRTQELPVDPASPRSITIRTDNGHVTARTAA